jgi:hypothetical protein
MLHVRLVATDVLRLAMRGPPFLGDVYCRWRMHGNGSVRCSYWLCEVRALFGVDVYCCWWMHGIGPVR